MGSELRILLCTPRFAPQVGGAETWTREVVGGLVRRGHRVVVVARSASGVAQRSREAGAIVHRVEGGRLTFAGAVMRAAAKLKPDVIVAQYSAMPPAMVAAHGTRVPGIAIVHDLYGLKENLRTRGPLRGRVRWLGLERSLEWVRPDAFLVPSNATAGGVRGLVPGAPVTVVPSGADHVRSPVGVRTARERGLIVLVGRLVPTKGAADLIEAVRVLRAEGSDVRAMVVGRGPEEPRLREAAAGVGAVAFAGNVDDDALGEIVASASVAVLPSTREGWGLAITEAAARGVPYVAYDIPAVREQHAILAGGLLVPPGPDHLAAALRELLTDPDRAAALGAAGRAAASRMTWDAAAEVVETAGFAAIGRRASG